jgi:hypothetical protein
MISFLTFEIASPRADHPSLVAPSPTPAQTPAQGTSSNPTSSLDTLMSAGPAVAAGATSTGWGGSCPVTRPSLILASTWETPTATPTSAPPPAHMPTPLASSMPGRSASTFEARRH